MEPTRISLRRDICLDVTFAHLPVRHAFARTPKVDPTPRASAASGNLIVDARGLRVRGDNGGVETPFAGLSCEVRDRQERRIAAVRSHKRRAATRLGSQDRGGATNYIRRVGETPPAVRRAPPPSVALTFLRSPFQTGVPGAIHTDAGISRS